MVLHLPPPPPPTPTATPTPTPTSVHAQAHLQSRVFDIDHGGKDIHKLLLASNRELKISKGAPAWRTYVEFVNDIVVDGLARTVSNSLMVVAEQVDTAAIAKLELLPWLEVQLELLPPAVQFQPPLGEDSGEQSVQSTVNER